VVVVVGVVAVEVVVGVVVAVPVVVPVVVLGSVVAVVGSVVIDEGVETLELPLSLLPFAITTTATTRPMMTAIKPAIRR